MARQVADTVLFEGYVLYPYRASSAKNQVRWQFGVLAPRGAAESEPWFSRTECLVEPDDGDPELTVTVRFLQIQRREGPPVWDEGVVQEVTATAVLKPGADEQTTGFSIPGGSETEGDVVRRRWRLSGVIRIATTPLEGPYGLLRVRIQVENHTAADHDPDAPRANMLPYALVSTHALLSVRSGGFVSLLEPPEWAKEAVASCRNEHTWPVLIGEGRRDVMLSSPIILYDHPEIAPESPGDFYDGTEIDELLTLRTMTLTDEEKREARETDPRAAAIVDRADNMPGEVLERLHGAVRYLRRVTGDEVPELREPTGDEEVAQMPVSNGGKADPQPWWDPGADRSVNPETDSVPVTGGLARRGSRVRLHPMGRADAQDMFLQDRTATVEAVLFDVDGSTHLAVTLDDDPAAELNRSVGRFLYFAPGEVELVEEAS
jgi:hypothetical protein